MSAAHAVAVAVVFVWLGMVVAISFIEAPLKFRAPGVSLPIGLGIGRLVFRALNAVEAVLAVALLIAIAADPPTLVAAGAVGVVVVTLATQLLVVRPLSSRRSDAVLAALACPCASMSTASGGLVEAVAHPLRLRRPGIGQSRCADCRRRRLARRLTHRGGRQ